ncbi:MAG TPA: hypothetical protein VMW62_08180 [Chloroflexota bacterium]|nr:hypothetical protein [Chloroflexota bacterium]
MADAIAGISNVQLGLLQSPEIAREQIPITAQVALANAQAAAIIARDDQAARGMVQRLQETDSQGVRDALSGRPDADSSRFHRRRPRQPVTSRAIPLAAAHPRGLGALVDFRA